MTAVAFIDSLKTKVLAIENEIAQTVSRHHGLLGLLQGTKEALADAEKVVGIVAPTSEAAAALETAENVVDIVDNAAEAIGSATSSSTSPDVPQ